ncbi:MAG: hypothetical protein E7620_01490 [Ruminococcaceae bacterium]|nr:hypothetical protein [Oscillospiraceae bacterium]
MKKLLSVLLSLSLFLGLAAMAIPAAAETAGKTVYLSDAGNDENAGTKEAPVATLLKAYQLLGAEGGTVSIIGTATVVKDPDENADFRALCKNMMNAIGKVTITSEDGTGKLSVASSGIWFPGDTELKNLVLYAAREGDVIYLVGNCHQLIIGENVTVEKAAGAPDYPVIYGSGMYSVMGWFGDNNKDTDVIVKSGRFSKVFAGGCTYHDDWGLVDDVKGNASVTVEGGEIGTLYGGGAGGGNGILTIEGNVTVTVKGGTIGKIVANNENKDAVIKGGATVTVSDGTVNEIAVNLFDGNDYVNGATKLICAEAYQNLASGFETVEVESDGKTVYLSDAGNDENAGTKEAPVATLLKAYQLLGAEGGTVSIVGTATVVKDPDENADFRALCKNMMNAIGKVTITSEDGTGKLSVASSGIWFPGETELKNMVLYAAREGDVIYLVANCHRLTIGENVTVEKAANAAAYPVIYGSGMYSVMGWFGDNNKDTDVIVKSGQWSKVYGGGCTYHDDWGLVDYVRGNINVTVEGGEIGELYGGSNGGGGNKTLEVEGNVTVTVNGGTIGRIVANCETNTALIKGDVTVTITDCKTNEILVKQFDGNDFVNGTTKLVCPAAFKGIAGGFETIETVGSETPDTPVAPPEEGVIYLSDAGSNMNNGAKTAPVATLIKAYQLLGAAGGEIRIIGDATVSGEYRALCEDATLLNLIGKVTITAEEGGRLIIAEQGIWFPGDTTIENIAIHCTYTGFNSYLVANCHDFVIGENVTVTKSDTAYGYPIIYGSGMYSFLWIPEGSSSNVTVKSGTWADVFGGGAANGRDWGTHIDDVTGNVTVTIEGGTIDRVLGGSNGGVGGTDPVVVFGNVEMNVKGGTIRQVIANGATANNEIVGNVVLNISGGSITEILVSEQGGDVYGKITLNCDDAYRAIAKNFPSEENNDVTEAPTDEPNAPTEETPTKETPTQEIPTQESTKAPTKEETKAPVPGTNAPAEEPQGGCASAFGSALILVVALGAGFLCKKKED